MFCTSSGQKSDLELSWVPVYNESGTEGAKENLKGNSLLVREEDVEVNEEITTGIQPGSPVAERGMRKMATSCISTAGAVFLAYYLLPLGWMLPLTMICFGAAALLLAASKRSDFLKRLFLCTLGTAVGFSVFLLHWNSTLRYAKIWDETEQSMQVRLMEAPTEGEYYTRYHVQRTEKPKIDLMLYDYREERSVNVADMMKPGELLHVAAKLRRADLRYGERTANYVSKDIYLTGTIHAVDRTGESRPNLSTMAAVCSRAVSGAAESLFSEDTATFMKALLLGDKTDFYQDTALYARMRGAGLMHVAAVSGMHIAFLVGMIQLLFGARTVSSAAGIALIWFFVFMTGASPSAVRAGLMQSILLMAPVFRRENDGITSLSLALAVILLVNPFSCASISLQLSFSAMAGMILLAEPLTNTILHALGRTEESWLRAPAAVAAGSLAVLIFSAPVTVLYFGTIAVYAPLTNLFGLWAVSLCFCFGWLSCLAGWFFPTAGVLLAMPAEFLMRYLMLLAGIICRLPHHLIAMQRTDMRGWLLLCYVLALIAWRSRAEYRLRLLMPLSLCVLTLAASLWCAKERCRNADGVIAALDVGQGECVCVLSGDRTLMFDCGGLGSLENAGETAAAWLESTGRNRVDALVLSHLHADHCNGVPMLLELVTVGEIILSPDADRDEDLVSEIADGAERHGVEITQLEQDSVLDLSGLRVELFVPPDDGSENERCIISLVSIGEYDMLFTGDSPKKAELELIEKKTLPDTELLIVGHHGSRSASDESFLHSIRAETAIISVGYNSYGHPTREVLARLQACGYETYRTDRNGTVEIWVNEA